MTRHEVFASTDATGVTLFSNAVSRDFGENRIVNLDTLQKVEYNRAHMTVSVMPLLCDPKECGLTHFGYILSTEE